MKILGTLLLACALVPPLAARAETITIAAASDLKFAMDEIARDFQRAHPQDKVEVVYGSSGKFRTQIQQGAPYDFFFSADIAFPQALAKQGLAAADVKPYAFGRIVLWSTTRDASQMTLAALTDPSITRIAIANPKHAPYGKRAEEALRAAGVWDQVRAKLVFAENIAQTAQYVQSGNADIGIIALALAVNPELASKGGYWLIPENLHQPLEQGYVITKRAEHNALAHRFADTMQSPAVRMIMTRFGFVLPGEALDQDKGQGAHEHH
jgi:molybdate transport system substrate-binding protein